MSYVPDPADFREIKYKVDDSHENFIVAAPPEIPDDYPFDPYGQLSHMIQTKDWREHCPEGKQPSALIVDTFSEALEDVGRFVATSGRGNTGVGVTYGLDMEDPWAPDSLRTRQMNDFAPIQDQTLMLLKMAMRTQRFPHVILVAHRKDITEEVMERQANGKYQRVKKTVGYDMAVPGKALLGNMTKFTEQYLWHSNEGVELMDIRLHLRGDGMHKTKFRSNKPNEVPGELEVPPTYEGMSGVIREVAKLTGVDMGSTKDGLRTVAYGDGGTGKTMLWTSLPEETFEVGPAVYVPYDPSAARLASVWDELRSKRH